MSHDQRIQSLDLFSGIGGISLALRPWVRTILYCEIDPYARRVIRARRRGGSLDRAPIWPDVTTLDPDPLAGHVDIITAGFPCQDISVAGKGRGLAGQRSGLFWQVVRLAGAIRPPFVLLENVPAITVRGGGDVVGAPHRRERWWCLAHLPGAGGQANGDGPRSPVANAGEGQTGRAQPDGGGQCLAHPHGLGLEKPGCGGRPETEGEASAAPNPGSLMGHAQRIGRGGEPRGWAGQEPADGCLDLEDHAWPPGPDDHAGWQTWASTGGALPLIRGGVDGLPHRVDRVRALGNAVVPQAARAAFVHLMGMQK